MNKQRARELANIATQEELDQMFEAAKNGITDWNAISSVNRGITKGAAWNILSKVKARPGKNDLGVKNAIWEFGDYYPGESDRPARKKREPHPNPFHQDPAFD